MIDLKNMRLEDILPQSLLKDEKIQNLSKVLSQELQFISQQADSMNFMMDINSQPEPIIDHLLWENHIHYDEGLFMAETIEDKRKLLENAIDLHRKKGTPYAVELLVGTLFGDGEVQEWFEYGGEPFYFRVVTRNPSATEEKAQEFIKAVNSVKRLSSHLEKVVLLQQEEMSLYWGGFVHVGSKEIYRQVT